MNDIEIRMRNSVSQALGVVLIVMGLIFLLDQYFHFDLAHYVWPFVIIVPGVALYVYSLGLASPEGEGVAVAGSIVAMIGTVLLVQNVTDLWATWAYAWALVAPTGVGVGFALYGMIKGRANLTAAGAGLIKIGLTLFLCFGVFFELLIGVSGLGLNRIGLPIVLILLGGWIVYRQATSARRTI
jgi:hypothetical protein